MIILVHRIHEATTPRPHLHRSTILGPKNSQLPEYFNCKSTRYAIQINKKRKCNHSYYHPMLNALVLQFRRCRGSIDYILSMQYPRRHAQNKLKLLACCAVNRNIQKDECNKIKMANVSAHSQLLLLLMQWGWADRGRRYAVALFCWRSGKARRRSLDKR